MTALTDAIRSHFVENVLAGHFDGDGLDKLLAQVEAAQARAAHHDALVDGCARALPYVEDAEHDPQLKPGVARKQAAQIRTLIETADSAVGAILKGNADLEQPTHDAHVRAMEAREAGRRG